MRRSITVSFLVSFVLLGGAVVGASLTKLRPHSDFSAGSTGHTVLTEPTGTYCTGCHSGAAVTGAFTDSAGAAITTAQLYPGEPGAFNIRASLANTYTGTTAPYFMGADIAASNTAGTLTSTDAYIIKSGTELQHRSTTTPPTLKSVAAGASNSYSFSYTFNTASIGATSTIAGVTVVDYVGGGQNVPNLVVTTRRPADPTSITPGATTSTSVVLNWLSSGPLNHVVVKTGAFATSPTDPTGTAYDVAGSTATISGLSPATTYFFKSWDLARFSPYDTYSTNSVTATAATTTAPILAANDLTVTNITSTGMSLTWTGTSPECRAIYKVGSVPTSPTDGTLIYEGVVPATTPSATVTGLTGGTRYFIAVYGKASGAATYSATADTTSVITLDGRLIDPAGAAGGPRQPNTSQGQMLYGNDPVYLFNGTTATAVQALPAPGENVDTVVFALGSASTAGHVIGGWRRGTDHLWISTDGGTPVLVPSAASNPINTTQNTNPENIAIADGCVFATLQAFSGGQAVKQVFRIDPVTGNATNLTGNAPVPGLNNRIRTSQCKAVWGFDDGTSNLQMQYYPGSGTAIQTIDTVAKSATFFGIGNPWISQGKIVYAKIVGTVPQVFLYDTTAATPAPVQLTNYTDATMGVSNPQTDGRHVVWFRSKTDGTLPEIDLNGGAQGVQLAAGPLKVLGNELELELNRGQILWKDANGTLRYETAASSSRLYLPSTIVNPWLADGYIAYGDSASAGAFRFTGTPPNDAQQPAAPLVVRAVPGTGSVTLTWDAILGASSYNVYYGSQPGLTKANYTSLGGTRITGITSPSFTASGLTPNAPYYFVITTVDPTGEGPESRQASAVVLGSPLWASVGSLPGTAMYAVAADATSSNAAYAGGSNNNTYASTDGGQTWSLLGGGIAAIPVHALAANNGVVFATSTNGSIYRSINGGASWSAVASGTSQSFQQSVAIDPAIPTTILAGEFRLPSFIGGLYDSNVIRSDDNGANWFHTPQSNSIVGYSLAFDPTHSSTLFLGGNGTPNVAKSLAGGAGWSDVSPGAGSGYVYTVAVDPKNAQTVYAGTTQAFGAFIPGVWKSTNGGATWTQINTGLPNPTAVHAIVVDPADSNLLHLGTEGGYYYSTNAGASWTLANGGLPTANAQFIYALAMTGSHRLIAGTGDGLYLLNLSVGPPPVVSSVNPNSGNVAGGTSVTITGSNFQSGATVTFGGVAATGVSFSSSSTLTAVTPAHAAAAVNVVVQNPDGPTGTLTSGFTYSTALTAPVVNALAASAAQINISWNAVSGATGYQLYRRAAGGGYILLNSAATSPYPDSGVTGGSSYLYFVRATNATTQADSAPDIATTIVFTDDPITAGSTIVKAVHLSELRNAANAVRLLGAQAAYTFTTGAASAGTTITAAQINEVRTALDGGLAALSLTTGGYTDTLATGVPIKAVHFQEIRNRVK